MQKKLINISKQLANDANRLTFTDPIAYVYNPLDYAWQSHKLYLERYGEGKGRVLLIGMNPGPWGMAQTGIPFGEVAGVRDFLGIETTVNRPQTEHPKRPVLGFDCPRSEVSGRRVWSWAKEQYVTANCFFEKFFVLNYCPLCFLEESGKNRTPDKLTPNERDSVYAMCDDALQKIVEVLEPAKIVGIGGFAKKRAMQSLKRDDIQSILHPSPASPIANRGWAPQIERQFEEMGVTMQDRLLKL